MMPVLSFLLCIILLRTRRIMWLGRMFVITTGFTAIAVLSRATYTTFELCNTPHLCSLLLTDLAAVDQYIGYALRLRNATGFVLGIDAGRVSVAIPYAMEDKFSNLINTVRYDMASIVFSIMIFANLIGCTLWRKLSREQRVLPV